MTCGFMSFALEGNLPRISMVLDMYGHSLPVRKPRIVFLFIYYSYIIIIYSLYYLALSTGTICTSAISTALE